MSKKNQWRPWMDLVNSKDYSTYRGQLQTALCLVAGYPETVREVVAAALSTARIMVEAEKRLPQEILALCAVHTCDQCLLNEGTFDCTVGSYKRNKTKKALRAYAACYENYLQGE